MAQLFITTITSSKLYYTDFLFINLILFTQLFLKSIFGQVHLIKLESELVYSDCLTTSETTSMSSRLVQPPHKSTIRVSNVIEFRNNYVIRRVSVGTYV